MTWMMAGRFFSWFMPDGNVDSDVAIALDLLHDGSLLGRHQARVPDDAGQQAVKHGLFESIRVHRFRRRLRPDFGEKRRDLLGGRNGRDASAQAHRHGKSGGMVECLHTAQDHLLPGRRIDVVREHCVGDLSDTLGQVRRNLRRSG